MDIEKIAEIAGKCGMKVHKFMCLPPIVSSFDAKPNEMIAYTNEIIELCAKECENASIDYQSQLEGMELESFINLEFAEGTATALAKRLRNLKG